MTTGLMAEESLTIYNWREQQAFCHLVTKEQAVNKYNKKIL